MTTPGEEPHIVYTVGNGIAHLNDRPGQDLLVHSFAGLTMNAGRASGLPHPSPLCMVDVSASYFLAHPQTQRYLTTTTHSVGGEYRTVAPAIRFSDDPVPSLRDSPRYCEHSREVLLSGDFSSAEVDKLFADGVAVVQKEDA